MSLSLGQGSGDFRETSGRVQPFHVGFRNSIGILTADAFTQENPPIITTPAAVSTRLVGILKRGVLGGSVAFTRYDAGNGYIGGPVQISGNEDPLIKPVGIFINDALGNPFENTPGVASGRGPYFSGTGALGVSLWETQNLDNNAALTYLAGQPLYASLNGLLTNRVEDAYETHASTAVTTIGIVKVAPDAQNTLLVLDLRI